MAEAIATWLLTTFLPTSAAIGGGTAVVVAGTTLAITTAIVKYVAVVAISMAASKLLTPKMPSLADSLGSRGQMVRSPIAARQIIYGRCKVSGAIVYLSTTGAKNEYLHVVLAVAGHEVEELGDVYFNEDLVLSGASDGSATGKYAGYADIYKKRGASGQTAFSTLVTDTASLTDGKWTSDHKLTGIACMYVRLKWNTEVYIGGIPNISVIVKGKKVYDPRTATTAYSTNSALCLRDYLTSSLGMAMTTSEIDDTSCTVAANVCDEQVQILPLSPTTYENRYETNGTISTSETPSAAIAKLLSAMAGLTAYSSGKMVIYAGTYQVPTITLSEKHFVGPISVTTRTSARDRVNTVKGVYISEENQWQPSDFPVITSATYVTQDNSIKYTRDVSLPMTVSPSCAQRLAVIELRRARQEIVLNARFRLEATQIRAGETVMISNAKLGWTNKVFEVMEWKFVTDGTPPILAVDMMLREIDSTVYSWTVSDEIAVADAPNTTLPNPFTIAAPTSLSLLADGTTQQYQADGTALPRIRVSWSAPSEEFVQSGGFIGIEYKETTSTTYLTWGRVPGDQTLEFISSDVRIGTGYNVRIYGESYFKVSSSYVSGVVTVQKDTVAPSVPTSLTANIGTGKAVSLDWDDVSSADLSEYGVYRNTTGVTPASAASDKIAETRSSRFFDAEVTVGTTYYYWVNAYDRLENVSDFSNRAFARPLGVTASPDLTPPSTPSAPTFKSERTYLASDGTALAAIVLTVPAVPSGGVALDILSRVSGTDGYKVEGQIDNVAASAFEIDDLTLGVAYDFACRGVNASGIYSALSTALTRTAPSSTTAPAAPTNVSITSTGIIPEYFPGSQILLFGTRVLWDASTETDFSYYEAKVVSTNDPNSTSYNWTPGPKGGLLQTRENQAFFYNGLLSAGYVYVRSVNRAKVASSWVYGGNANSAADTGYTSLGKQESGNVSVTGGTVNSVTMNAVSITATKVKVPITVSGTQYRGLEANETTAVDVYAVNLRVYDNTTTQKFRVDNATGELYVQSSKVVSTRYGTTPTTLNEVISALQHHGLVP